MGTEATETQRESCKCIANINEQLDGQELETGLMLSRDLRNMYLRTFTPLIRKDNSKRENRSSKPRQAAHKFCPFCGTRYEAEHPPTRIPGDAK